MAEKVNGIDENTLRKLRDSHWQSGLIWRKEKIEIAANLRRNGISEKVIFRELKKCGLTNSTANEIMNDAEYFNDGEKSIFDKSPEEARKEVDKFREESATDYMKRRKAEKEKQKNEV